MDGWCLLTGRKGPTQLYLCKCLVSTPEMTQENSSLMYWSVSLGNPNTEPSEIHSISTPIFHSLAGEWTFITHIHRKGLQVLGFYMTVESHVEIKLGSRKED